MVYERGLDEGRARIGFMRRGLLKDYANAVCGVVTGSQMPDPDLDLLLARGVGSLEMDVLGGTARIDGVPARIRVGDTVRAWLRDRAVTDGLEWSAVERALVTVAFDCRERTPESGIGTVWRHLEYRCSAELSAGGRTAMGSLQKVEVWIKDGPTATWTAYEGQALAQVLEHRPDLRQWHGAVTDVESR